MKNKNAYIAIAVVCVVLTAAITVQIRTMREESSAVSVATANSELKDSLLEWKERAENAERDLEESTKELETIRNESTTDDNSATEKQEELKKYNQLIGLTDVTGEGIVLTVSDSSADSTLLDMSSLIVHDSDLRNLINELANAGAEAISINDERIVNSSCVTCAGNVIQINGKRVGSPFEIKAIGNAQYLESAMNIKNGVVDMLKQYGVDISVRREDNIEIKKFDGTRELKYSIPKED